MIMSSNIVPFALVTALMLVAIGSSFSLLLGTYLGLELELMSAWAYAVATVFGLINFFITRGQHAAVVSLQLLCGVIVLVNAWVGMSAFMTHTFNLAFFDICLALLSTFAAVVSVFFVRGGAFAHYVSNQSKIFEKRRLASFLARAHKKAIREKRSFNADKIIAEYKKERGIDW